LAIFFQDLENTCSLQPAMKSTAPGFKARSYLSVAKQRSQLSYCSYTKLQRRNVTQST